ncbi:MAG TPA: hypothetical protein VM422_09185 [Amaricoccus sp.]|jgi:hypothetical protein|nr:hypothetical protein [Amaricoccus sp.]
MRLVGGTGAIVRGLSADLPADRIRLGAAASALDPATVAWA